MSLWFDVKYAWRLLTKSWGCSLMCASVVALSVGLAIWTYAVVYSQSLKPLGFPGSERWYSVQLAADATSRARPSVDLYTWQQIVEHNRTADILGAFADQSVVLSEGQATTSLRGGLISPRLLAATTVPMLGRTLAATDGQPGTAPVAVISYETWQHYFGGDLNVIGRTARMNATNVQIIGVLPKDYLAFDDFEVWMPLHWQKLARPQDSGLIVYPLIVLREGQTIQPILNEMKSTIARVNGDYPRLFNATRRVELIPGYRMFTHGVTPIVMMIGVMAGAVLLLGCVNISMVFFARLLERSRELALRSALGSSRQRLLRQCLVETALIVALGLIAGYALAALGVYWTHTIDSFGSRILAHGRSTNLPEMQPFDLVIAIVSAIAVWLLSTLVPAWRVARQDAAAVLAGSGKGATSRGSSKSVALLVGLQVVISCFVLVMCGNVVNAIHNEVKKPNGIDTANVLLSTDPTDFDERYAQPAQRLRYWDELSAAIERKVPGAKVAFMTAPPTRPARLAATIETREGGDNKGALTLPVTTVSANYFNVLNIGLRTGRLFDSSDNRDSQRVAVVDENMAARYWPNENAIGKRVRINTADDAPWLTIVGVVSAVRGAPYRPDAELGALYRPLRQEIPASFHLIVKLPNAAQKESVVALRAAAFGVDRDLPLHNLQALHDYIEAINLSYPAMTRVFIGIALITALLAASGLFGLISRSVAQRTQEVGIRRALGATPLRATSMFLRQGALYLSVAVIGLAFGLMVMPALSKAITNILEDIVPATLAVVVLMAAVIFTASYLPTRKALALEPGDALRYE
ncbi:MAG TPA: ABC transporter permease [Thermoanaerobaculia bacterium]|nr:ABC transporter permease [Thermoanaerobaculia bacterium]